MNPDWTTFLTDAGAEFTETPEGQIDEVNTFGNPDREKRFTLTGNVFCDLSHLGMIAVSGEDAEPFLQGQLTADVSSIDHHHSVLSGYCNPKGRLLALFLLFKRADTYYLLMPSELVAATLKRLQMYVLMSKVVLEDASGTLIRFGVSGPEAESQLEAAIGTVPEQEYAVEEYVGTLIVRMTGVESRFLVIAELNQAKSIWEKLNVHCAPVGACSWRLMDVMTATPSIYSQTVEAFVPQMVNLEMLGGVSFKKGCYTGQEVIARLHYLGKPKRRMYMLVSETEELPKPGTQLYSADDDTGQPVGTIVSRAHRPDGGMAALAVVKIEYAKQGAQLQLASAEGEIANVMPPPYSLEIEKAS